MDKRSEARVQHNIRFFVHVHECAGDPTLQGLEVPCEAVDFSPHGLQFHTDQPLIPESLLNISIGMGESIGKFLLRGEIRWVRKVGDAHAVGCLLQDTDDTDFKSWESRFATTFLS